jgi:hypothetical protein
LPRTWPRALYQRKCKGALNGARCGKRRKVFGGLDAVGNQSDSLHALVNSSRVIELRVPYPIGFFAKQIDGRIDDPNAGWQGRGLWVTSGNRTPVHIECRDASFPGAPGTTLATQSSPLVIN